MPRTVHATPPAAPPPGGPLPPRGLVGEWRTALQPWRLALQWPRLLLAPRGDGGPVVDLPGWRAGEATMAPMRAYLQLLGHDVRGWGLGTNVGDVEGLRDRLLPTVVQLAEATGRRVALVGWSLGGVIAREVARRRPDVVRTVVTYGSPVVGGPLHTAAASRYAGSERARAIAERQAATDRDDPLRVPVTSIFSRDDRVVDWRASIDRDSPDTTHVEVGSTHLGLGLDPDVWVSVARALA